jgi:CheY-like chemotaxis protein/HPt (histidine-containing phosphotransfer) domain-containing protein
MDGFTLSRAIRSDPMLFTTRIVLMKPLNSQLDELEKQLGIDASITKPIRQLQLLDCIARLVGGFASNEEPAMTGQATDLNRLMSASASPGALSKKLLLVEDNPVNQEVARLYLEKLGYTVDIVSNGVEAVSAIESRAYVAVLMDCEMPVMDGYAATAEIRSREGPSKHTIIIAMTAHAMEGDRERCVASGMDDYIGKPIVEQELVAVLNRWMSDPESAKNFSTESRPQESVPSVSKREEPLPEAIDSAFMNRLRLLESKSEENLVGNLIDLFLRDAVTRIASLGEAVTRGNSRLLAQTAHALKSGCYGIGAMYLARLCQKLEEKGRSDSVEDVKELIDGVENEFERVRSNLETELNKGRMPRAHRTVSP